MRNLALIRCGGGTRYCVRGRVSAGGGWRRVLSLYRLLPNGRRTRLARVRVDYPGVPSGVPSVVRLECVERAMGARLPSWKVMAALLAQLA